MIGSQVCHRRKLDLQHIGTVSLIITGKMIFALVVGRIAYVDDPLGKQ